MEFSSLQLGCDIVFIPRLKDKIDQQKFLDKILTLQEQELFNSLKTDKRKLEFLAGRFAAKEAYAKAKGTGIGKVDFLDFEVLKDELGKPIAKNAKVSISHDEDYAIAMVIIND